MEKETNAVIEDAVKKAIKSVAEVTSTYCRVLDRLLSNLSENEVRAYIAEIQDGMRALNHAANAMERFLRILRPTEFGDET